MPQLRRTRYAFFYCEDRAFLDVARLLRGEAAVAPLRQILGISILAGREVPLSETDLHLLFSIPSDGWIDETDNGFESQKNRIGHLVEQGFVLTDGFGKHALELRRRDEMLAAGAWHVYNALFHFLAKWGQADIGPPPPFPTANDGELAVTQAWVDEFGPPPPHFHSLQDPLSVFELPLVRGNSGLYDVLERRRTSRSFDTDNPMTTGQLSVILYYVAGCHGYAQFQEGIVMLRKTSPSAGALHPTETYVLTIRVAGIEPGLYHYSAERHALELLKGLTYEEAADLADEFTAAQRYPRDAHVLFILTARFYRSFWKYRWHKRAYAALLMDAGHLSQSLYLVCTELGLGAFVTAAINAEAIETELGLDPYAEGALAVCGCGIPAAERGPLEPEFAEYVPGMTIPKP